jgi:hypothetical protein
MDSTTRIMGKHVGRRADNEALCGRRKRRLSWVGTLWRIKEQDLEALLEGSTAEEQADGDHRQAAHGAEGVRHGGITAASPSGTTR